MQNTREHINKFNQINLAPFLNNAGVLRIGAISDELNCALSKVDYIRINTNTPMKPLCSSLKFYFFLCSASSMQINFTIGIGLL